MAKSSLQTTTHQISNQSERREMSLCKSFETITINTKDSPSNGIGNWRQISVRIFFSIEVTLNRSVVLKISKPHVDSSAQKSILLYMLINGKGSLELKYSYSCIGIHIRCQATLSGRYIFEFKFHCTAHP